MGESRYGRIFRMIMVAAAGQFKAWAAFLLFTTKAQRARRNHGEKLKIISVFLSVLRVGAHCCAPNRGVCNTPLQQGCCV